jgi:class 3 adenylate cyclase
VKRKLTTILFADAQGYSALMASNEAATLERLIAIGRSCPGFRATKAVR